MARGDFPSAKQDQYMLRFPDGMRDEIRRFADQRGRSMNSEIVQRLKQTLEHDADKKSVHFRLPIETWVRLDAEANALGLTDLELAMRKIDGQHDEAEGTSALKEKVLDLEWQKQIADQKIEEIKKESDVRLILYYNKLIEIDQLLERIATEEPRISNRTSEAMKNIQAACQTELQLFRKDRVLIEIDAHRNEVIQRNSSDGNDIVGSLDEPTDD